MNEPQTLFEAIAYFGDQETAEKSFISVRWAEGVRCPHCGSEKWYRLAKARVWKCAVKHPRQKFSVKTSTIFEESPISLGKWLVALWLETSAKNSISSHELARHLGVTQKTSWFMLHRIRHALKAGAFEKIGGEGKVIEADECFIGGAGQNMHQHKRLNKMHGPVGKAAIVGMLERTGENKHSNVKAQVVADTRKKKIHAVIYNNVERGTMIYTDDQKAYRSLGNNYYHEFVNHSIEYVRDQVHTNTLENFWSLFKRALKGTHVSVWPTHLQAYLDSEVFRFNNRKMSDGERTLLAMQNVTGKRLTYKQLTGRV